MAQEEKVQNAVLPPKNKYEAQLRKTAAFIATRGKGILAADESTGTIGKRFKAINVENTTENSRAYRELLFTTPDLEKYISGVIMYDATIRQKTAKGGVPFARVLAEKLGHDFSAELKAKKEEEGKEAVPDPDENFRIITGIKVDMGPRALPYKPNETYTQGLTDLDKRAAEYYKLGARFAKWRAVLKIQNSRISQTSIQETAWTLARYAAICQVNGLVPIVEPEILMDGDHSIEVCQYWTEKVLSACYKALNDQEVILEGTLLKPNMVLAGIDNKAARSMEKNAGCTVAALRRCVPAAVPGITFLSGGQSEEEASLNLNAINSTYKNLPWSATFSFGRALQKSCLAVWQGKVENIEAAQKALMVRAEANSQAQRGEYKGGAGGKAAQDDMRERNYVY